MVASSSQASEVIQVFNASKRVKWLREMLAETGLVAMCKPTPMLVDSTNAVSAISSITDKNKHMGIYLAYLRMLVKEKVVAIHHIPREQNVADLLTKQGTIEEFQRLRKDMFEPFVIENESHLM